MEEVWKEIKNWEGLYEISNLGRISCVKNGDRKIIKLYRCTKGYLMTTLYDCKRHKVVYAHRLVAINFLKNDDNLKEVNHVDEDKNNNKVSNLEWCTHKYNMNYGTRSIRSANNRSKKISQKLNGIEIATFKSSREVSELFGFNRSFINFSCRNGTMAHGFNWEYV